MSKTEQVFIIIALYLIAFALFFNAFRGRYQYCIGQNDIHGIDYLPKILDTWTGNYKSLP